MAETRGQGSGAMKPLRPVPREPNFSRLHEHRGSTTCSCTNSQHRHNKFTVAVHTLNPRRVLHSPHFFSLFFARKNYLSWQTEQDGRSGTSFSPDTIKLISRPFLRYSAGCLNNFVAELRQVKFFYPTKQITWYFVGYNFSQHLRFSTKGLLVETWLLTEFTVLYLVTHSQRAGQQIRASSVPS